jgi:signal transduction histidine kinase
VREISSIPAQDRILVLDDNQDSCLGIAESVSSQIPSAVVEAVSSVPEMWRALNDTEYDVVILNHALSHSNPIELLHQLKVQEREPAVLMVSESADPAVIADMYNHGCQRCLVKEGDWHHQLGPSIRHALRYRKLQERNQELRSRLVEANIQLEEKNQRLDEFSATLAHDIRGPLAGLSMKLDFILEQMSTQLDERSRGMLLNSLRSVERLTRIVHSMHEYAKLGVSAVHMEKVSLEPLVREVVADMFSDEPIQMKLELGSIPAVWGNRELLRRVFMNLLSNSVKYNDSSPVVIRIGCDSDKPPRAGFIDIVLDDNGRGIPTEERESIFGMFQRGSSAGADTDGTGIGLAVVQRIAELHGGRITIAPKEDNGTKFVLSLPHG